MNIKTESRDLRDRLKRLDRLGAARPIEADSPAAKNFSVRLAKQVYRWIEEQGHDVKDIKAFLDEDGHVHLYRREGTKAKSLHLGLKFQWSYFDGPTGGYTQGVARLWPAVNFLIADFNIKRPKR